MPLFNALIAPWIIDQTSLPPQGASHVLVANQVYLWAFEIQAPITITNMRWKMAATATGTTDAGIYDSSGNLLAHTGATANSANVTQTVALTSSLTIGPGRYAMAICPSNATDTYSDVAAYGSSLGRVMGCANAGSLGVLPNPCGAFAAAGNCPIMAAVISGGAP